MADYIVPGIIAGVASLVTVAGKLSYDEAVEEQKAAEAAQAAQDDPFPAPDDLSNPERIDDGLDDIDLQDPSPFTFSETYYNLKHRPHDASEVPDPDYEWMGPPNVSYDPEALPHEMDRTIITVPAQQHPYVPDPSIFF